MATFIVETGSGVTGANVYWSLASIDSWLAERNLTSWSSLTTTQKESAIFTFMDWLESQNWKGYKTHYDNPLCWPRDEVYDQDGFLVPWNEIPNKLKYALARGAYEESVTPGTFMPTGSQEDYITRKKIDVLEFSYSKVVPEKIVRKVNFYIDGFIEGGVNQSGGTISVVRT